MLKYFLILNLFTLTLFAGNGQKYFIYFKDKGNNLTKYTDENKLAFLKLSDKSLSRREKLSNNLITYEDIPVNEFYINKLQAFGVKIIHILDWFNSVSCILTDEQLKLIVQLPFVEKIEKVKSIRFYKKELSSPLTNYYFPKSYYSRNYGASLVQNELSNIPKVHDLNITGKGVIIGVLDSGFEWRTHDALKNINVIAEKDFVFNDNNTANEIGDDPAQSSHGTYCLSILSGYKEGTLIGAAFESSFILAKTEDIRSETRIEEDNYAAALQWMENLGVDIVTSSLGYNEFDNFSYTYADMNGRTTICTKAAEIAFSKGVITVTSAGNEGNNNWRYITAPADGFNIISVGAVNSSNEIASFSSRGPAYDGRIKPEVTAMGVGVIGADAYSNSFRYASGTSSAAPIVAGVASLLLSKYNYLTNEQVRNIIIESGNNVKTPNNDIGYGLLDAYYAITYPNIRKENNDYIVTKMFDNNNISNVTFNYCLNGDWYSLKMAKKEQNLYEIILPKFNVNDVVNFSFSYSNEFGNLEKIPENGTFKLKYGFLPIELNKKIYEDSGNFDYNSSTIYPNPFDKFTNIEFIFNESSFIEVQIYDILGKTVKYIYGGICKKGKNTYIWDGKDNNNNPCASGVYIVACNFNGNLITNKVLLLK